MNLKNIRNSFGKIKSKGKEYFKKEAEKKQIDLEVKNLKNRYKEEGIGKDVFSEKNKKLISIENEMKKIKQEIIEINQEIKKDIQKELQNVIG